ncbi:MAG: multicopper oxidase domain-containing protein [Epsilonproteobacteria bacterium]|nr:multicopper oxidase domain-containing protein [Campylobacterota bacterium]
MKRRTFLSLSAVAAATILIGQSFIPTNKINATDFKSKLPIPPMLEGEEINGVINYNLEILKAKHNFFKDVLTDTYAINGTYLGPTLKLKNGSKVSINYTNKLNESTTMHGHGMHLPANMDGSPHQLINPNETWSAKYQVKQRACTNWYHPHPEGRTAWHVYKGLAGLMIIEDNESQDLDIPRNYGVDDIPLVLQDRFFDRSGQIYYSPSMMQVIRGYISDTFVTNGAINPYIDVEAKEIRLRLLNGSNSTVYHLKFSDGRDFKQIAVDNSFLQKPVTLDYLRLSPGERAEIIIDLQDSFGKSFYLKELKENRAFVKFNVSKKATKKTKTPKILTKLESYSPKDAVNLRTFTLSAGMRSLYINGKSMEMDRIDEIVPINKIEIWEIYNQRMMMMGMQHNFHIHGTHFIILERNGKSSNVNDNEKGYKDTVYIGPGERVKLLVKMTDYIDEKVPYMYHCHFLEHEDAGMMGQFIVSKNQRRV